MYLSGFGNYHQTEAIAGALPTKQNSPQHCHLGLYAEQISGSAFTEARHTNLHSWVYRILPSVVHTDYTVYSTSINDTFIKPQPPNPMRWSALAKPNTSIDFVDGLFHFAGNRKLNTYVYQCNQSMTHRYFSDRDGELLFVPYQGSLCLRTEFGNLDISPGMIAVIPRGVLFKIEIKDALACGYVCENAGLPLKLPQLGIMGANALANPRHFIYPHAAYEENQKDVTLICKYQNHTWSATAAHSPLNVVAWHGNYAPYSYDLSLFNTINTVSFDHPDPSIFTVLTSDSNTPGVANLDFVIFPPRWMVAEETFRPPYFHRNIMNELMGLLIGEYDAKAIGFEVGGVSIHNCMTAHGPDSQSYHQATIQHLQPKYYNNTLAFMFESKKPWFYTESAFNHPSRQGLYSGCWQNLQKAF
ncbi:homogentisate 1,2-dioxygenase [bacterium]|nr:homogentisate 1,2-dioxygenase [bacterium]